jgi:hypothetical protein
MSVRRADDISYTLAANASGTGNAVIIKGGEYIFTCDGTAGGTTISLQVLTLNNVWTDVSVYSGSVVKSTTMPYAQTGIDLPAGSVRLNCAGGSPSGVYAYLVGVG